MAKQFNQAFIFWLQDFYDGMNTSADLRADLNEVIVNLGIDNTVVENHEKLIKNYLMNLVSLYHVINRNPEKFKALIELLKPEDNG